jgi:hypothetical protein
MSMSSLPASFWHITHGQWMVSLQIVSIAQTVTQENLVSFLQTANNLEIFYIVIGYYENMYFTFK